MPASNQVAYDPNDPGQAEFLSALGASEGGTGANAYSTGTGGYNLSGASTDAFGFPQWLGIGGSHAAGQFQFQPGTWDQVAGEYNLNFQNPEDQNAGAWYYAEQEYAQNTGGSLEQAIASGDVSSIQSGLGNQFLGVKSSTFVNALGGGTGATLASSPNAAASTSSSGGVVGWVEQFGLIIVGAVIVIVALWQLLSNQGVVPSPKDTVAGVTAAL
jgi:hypothetical protein